MKQVVIGSEGTLAVVVGVTLRGLPARQAAFPVMAVYRDLRHGIEAVDAIPTGGVVPAVLEYLDGATISLTGLPAEVRTLHNENVGFVIIAETDGAPAQASADRATVLEAASDGALYTYSPTSRSEIDGLWRWRDGVSLGVNSLRGGKLSEDDAVPSGLLGDVIAATLEIGERHGVPACSWGHAGDGNLHSTFLIAPGDEVQQAQATAAAEELFDLVAKLGGAVSGEHGVGLVKRLAAERHTPPEVKQLQLMIKHAFDPKGLLNPGKKLPDDSLARRRDNRRDQLCGAAE